MSGSFTEMIITFFQNRDPFESAHSTQYTEGCATP